MGSKEMAKKFLETSGVSGHYASIIDFTFTYFVKKAEQSGSQAAEELKKIKDEYPQEFAKGIGLAEEAYSEMFTDEELQELTVMHGNPVLMKLRGSTEELMQKIAEKLF